MAKLKELEKNIFYKKELVETGSQLDLVKWRFDELGMDLSDLTRIVYEHQHTYYSFLDKKECENAIRKVLKKREIQQILITAINLDVLCEQDCCWNHFKVWYGRTRGRSESMRF